MNILGPVKCLVLVYVFFSFDADVVHDRTNPYCWLSINLQVMSIYSILGQEFFMFHGANYTFTNDPRQIWQSRLQKESICL